MALILLLQANSSLGGFTLLLPLGLIAFVLLTAIPQQRRQKKWAEQLTQLKPGDRVTTTGGLRGSILSVKDDSFVLRLAPDGVKVECIKTAIASVITDDTAPAS